MMVNVKAANPQAHQLPRVGLSPSRYASSTRPKGRRVNLVCSRLLMSKPHPASVTKQQTLSFRKNTVHPANVKEPYYNGQSSVICARETKADDLDILMNLCFLAHGCYLSFH